MEMEQHKGGSSREESERRESCSLPSTVPGLLCVCVRIRMRCTHVCLDCEMVCLTDEGREREEGEGRHCG